MKISEEFRKASESPDPDLFYAKLGSKAFEFAEQFILPEDHAASRLTLRQKTFAYLLLAAIAESEGL